MRIYVNDVAVRDGFQIEKAFVPTDTKVEVINQLARTGLHKIEVTSFVSPKAVPALADAVDVLSRIDRVPGVVEVRPGRTSAEIACHATAVVSVVADLATRGLAPDDLTVTRPSLEDAFVALTRGGDVR